MKYVLTSVREDTAVIDGLGVIAAGEILEVDAQAAEAFRHNRGLALAQVDLPEGVRLHIDISESVDSQEEVN